jgi:DNA invertase Pin-like site-specific DNA recombinase
MGRSPRALITVRLTVQTGSTTSPERQIEECKSFCELRGWEIVGVASDLSVSATSVPPWKRPELSRWLDDHAPEFDVIVFWRLDRFVRRVGDLHQMIEWAESHGGKGLVSATEPFDLTSPTGKAAATMIATFAQMEAHAAAERVASSRAHLLTSTRWGGSSPPFGYRTYARDGARYLEVNPETADIVREAARRVIGGEPINAICRDLEERGVPSPADTYQRNKSGKDFIWYPRTLKGILTSPTLLGWKTRSEDVPGKKYKKRVLVRDQDGHPVRVTEGVLSQETFDRLQDAPQCDQVRWMRQEPSAAHNQETAQGRHVPGHRKDPLPFTRRLPGMPRIRVPTRRGDHHARHGHAGPRHRRCTRHPP